MKRFVFYFLIALLTFSGGVLISIFRNHKPTSQALNIPARLLDFPCAPDAFTLKNQPDATLQLHIIEANCNGASWNARLTLQNLGPKAIRGYEVANIENYEHIQSGESSQAVIASAGVLLAPGRTITLNFGAGFQNCLSYGKPTGSIQKNVFWIKRAEYTDGTSWQSSDKDR